MHILNKFILSFFIIGVLFLSTVVYCKDREVFCIKESFLEIKKDKKNRTTFLQETEWSGKTGKCLKHIVSTEVTKYKGNNIYQKITYDNYNESNKYLKRELIQYRDSGKKKYKEILYKNILLQKKTFIKYYFNLKGQLKSNINGKAKKNVYSYNEKGKLKTRITYIYTKKGKPIYKCKKTY